MKMVRNRKYRGFTLLEVTLAVAVFVLLITTALALVGATTELMAEVSEAQNKSALRLRFVETCRSAFESMTAKSSVEFYYKDRGGGKTDTYLCIVNTPEAFDFGMNRSDEIERVVLATEIRSSGAARVGVYYMTAADFELARESGFATLDSDYVELVPELNFLQWEFYDEDAQTWRTTLDGNFDTSLLKLRFRISGNSPPMESVFWYLNG